MNSQVFITSFFALIIILQRTGWMAERRGAFDFGSWPGNYIVIYAELFIWALFLWIFTFHPITNLHLLFLVVIALLAPGTFFFLEYVGKKVGEQIEIRGELVRNFLFILCWFFISSIEVGYFGLNIILGFFYPLLAYMIGLMIFMVVAGGFTFSFFTVLRTYE